uniref:Uncharacterized protein n=1 Tax=Ditylenchus dipsaci TaxID=166011 RepID=A0A915DNB1_9BILA
MESTGVAGRVHISQSTANFLDNQYMLEESADHHGMKTYFIAGRSKELESASNQFINASDSDSGREQSATLDQLHSETGQKLSFRKSQSIDAPCQTIPASLLRCKL